MNCNFMYIFLLVTTEIAFCFGISTEQLQGTNAHPLQSDTDIPVGAHPGLVKRSPAYKRLPGWSVYYGKRSADAPTDSNEAAADQAERILEDISSEIVQDPQNDREEKLKDIFDFEKWMQHNDNGGYNTEAGSGGGEMAKRMDIKRLQSWMSTYGKRDSELTNTFITDEDLDNQVLEGDDSDPNTDSDDLKRAAWLPGYGKRAAWLPGYGKRAAWLPGYGKRAAWLPGYGKRAAWLPGYGKRAAWLPGYGKRAASAWFNGYGKRAASAWFNGYGKRAASAWFNGYGKRAASAWFNGYGKRSPAWFSNYGKRSPAWFSNYGKRSPAWFSNYGKRSPAWFSNYGKRSPAWFSNYGKRSQVWPTGYGRRSPAWFSSYGKRAGWNAGYGKREGEDGAPTPSDSDLDALRETEAGSIMDELKDMDDSISEGKDWPSVETEQSQTWSTVL